MFLRVKGLDTKTLTGCVVLQQLLSAKLNGSRFLVVISFVSVLARLVYYGFLFQINSVVVAEGPYRLIE